MLKRTSVIILCGGDSSRMKEAKASLKIGGISFLEKAISIYRHVGIEEIILVLNKKLKNVDDIQLVIRKYNSALRIRLNSKQDKGKMYSLKLGCELVSMENKSFVQYIDNPFIDEFMITSMMEEHCEGYIVPTFNGKGGHPILLSSEIIRTAANLTEYDINLKVFLSGFNRKNQEQMREDILFNINTPDDYRKYIIEAVQVNV